MFVMNNSGMVIFGGEVDLIAQLSTEVTGDPFRVHD